MVENENVFVAFSDSGADFRGHGAWKLREDIGKPRRVSIQKMIDQGWLQKYEDSWGLYEVSESGRVEVEKLAPFDFVSKAKSGWSSDMILSALRNRFKPGEWLWCEELHVEEYRTRRIDAWAMRIVSGKERDLTKYLTKVAVEVKVDRADFLDEIKNPTKRQPAMSISNVFMFAAPAGLIMPDEVPRECGLIEVHSRNRTVMRVRPPWRVSDNPDWKLVAALARTMRK